MALTGGQTFFTDDCVGCLADAPNIADRLEAAGRTWTAYMEDMPSACLATDSGLYVAKHNPFVHYRDIVSDSARCSSHVVPFSRFSADLSSGNLAHFVWITPNLCNDMHDCSIATGDAWLSTRVPRILQSPAFRNSVLFLTWDEARSGSAVTGSISTDGVNWRTVGSVNSPIGSSALIGLAVTSHTTSALNTSTFDSVSVVP